MEDLAKTYYKFLDLPWKFYSSSGNLIRFRDGWFTGHLNKHVETNWYGKETATYRLTVYNGVDRVVDHDFPQQNLAWLHDTVSKRLRAELKERQAQSEREFADYLNGR